MSNDSASSGSSSPAMTPPSAAPNRKLTEAEYLQQQAQQAKDAMTHALSQMGAHLRKSADPSPLIRRHPFISLAAGLAGGTLVGSMLGGRRRKRQEAARFADYEPPSAKPRRAGLLGVLLGELARAAGPIIAQSFRGVMGTGSSPAQDSNGHASEQSPRGTEPPPT